MANINFFALGGLDENGKNSYVLEIDNDLFVINAGTKVPINSATGIDTLIPSFDFLQKNQHRIRGIFITDVKNESFSAIPWLLMQIPNAKIYSSEFSKHVIEERISKYKIENGTYKVFTIEKKTKLGKVYVDPIGLAGSLFGINGYNFETQDGNVLFLLNFVLGNAGIFGRTDLNLIKRKLDNKPLLALFVDSGKANLLGNSFNKIDITPTLSSFFEQTSPNARIIVGSYDEEMYLIHEVLGLAKKHKRPVVIYGKNYNRLLDLSELDDFTKNSLPVFLDYKKLNKTKNAVVIVSGSVERLYQRFLRIADNNDVFLKLKSTDAVVMAAPPVNGLEVDYAKTLDQIAKTCPNLIDISETQLYPMRPAKKDIYDLVKFLRPKYFIPLQGLYRYLTVAAQEAQKAGLSAGKTFVLQNGKTLAFVNGELFSQKGIIKEVGETIIDGFGVGDISSEVIRERETLARDGMLSISWLFSYKTKELIGDISIASAGLITKEKKTEIHELVKSLVLQYYRENGLADIKTAQEKIRKMIKKKLFRLMDREPIVLIKFYDI
ncbi:ribonuclease J [Candidatus Mycoplasma pogonae]